MITLVSIYEGLLSENLGIQRIEAFMQEQSIDVETIYIPAEKIRNGRCFYNFGHTDMIGISVYANTLAETRIFVKELKHRFPQMVVFAGSQYFTACYATVFKEIPDFDFGILGTGEFPLQNVVNQYHEVELHKIIASSPHLVSPTDQANKKICMTDIQQLPWPTHKRNILEKDLFAYLNTSQGCVGNCSFCGYIRCKWSGRDPADIVQEMLSIRKHYNIRAFSFSDNSIEDPGEYGKNRLHRIAKEIIQTQKKFALNGFIRADSFSDCERDNEILRDLRAAGFNQFLVGIESGNAEDLQLYNKRATVDQNLKILPLLEKNDIHPFFGFINLNPYSTVDRLIKNYEFLEKCNNYFPGHYFSYLIIYENTKIYHQMKKDGILEKVGSEYTYFIKDPVAKEYYHFIQKYYIKTEFSQVLFDIQNSIKIINYLTELIGGEELSDELLGCKQRLSDINKNYFSIFFQTLSFDKLYGSFDNFRQNVINERDCIRRLYTKVLHRYFRIIKNSR